MLHPPLLICRGPPLLQQVRSGFLVELLRVDQTIHLRSRPKHLYHRSVSGRVQNRRIGIEAAHINSFLETVPIEILTEEVIYRVPNGEGKLRGGSLLWIQSLLLFGFCCLKSIYTQFHKGSLDFDAASFAGRPLASITSPQTITTLRSTILFRSESEL